MTKDEIVQECLDSGASRKAIEIALMKWEVEVNEKFIKQLDDL